MSDRNEERFQAPEGPTPEIPKEMEDKLRAEINTMMDDGMSTRDIAARIASQNPGTPFNSIVRRCDEIDVERAARRLQRGIVEEDGSIAPQYADRNTQELLSKSVRRYSNGLLLWLDERTVNDLRERRADLLRSLDGVLAITMGFQAGCTQGARDCFFQYEGPVLARMLDSLFPLGVHRALWCMVNALSADTHPYDYPFNDTLGIEA